MNILSDKCWRATIKSRDEDSGQTINTQTLDCTGFEAIKLLADHREDNTSIVIRNKSAGGVSVEHLLEAAQSIVNRAYQNGLHITNPMDPSAPLQASIPSIGPVA